MRGVVRVLKIMCLMASGGRPVRGDLFVRWPREAENEILEVFEEAHEHEAQQGPHPFQGTCSHSVEDYPRVSVSHLLEIRANCGFINYLCILYLEQFSYWGWRSRCIRVSTS